MRGLFSGSTGCNSVYAREVRGRRPQFLASDSEPCPVMRQPAGRGQVNRALSCMVSVTAEHKSSKGLGNEDEHDGNEGSRLNFMYLASLREVDSCGRRSTPEQGSSIALYALPEQLMSLSQTETCRQQSTGHVAQAHRGRR